MKVAAACFALAVWVGIADAGPKRKVRIETNPVGAAVYIESKENGAACEPTPCTIELPIGETPLIVELPSYDTIFPTINVPKRGKVKLDALTLNPSIGTLVIEGPPGASITVNGEDKGKAPAKLEVSADTHKVVITKAGKIVFDQYVDVGSGAEKEVAVLDITGGAADGDLPSDGDDILAGGDDTDGGDITKTAPSAPRTPIASVSVAMSIGFRQFSYENNTTRDKLRDESESGQVILGPLVELWPGTLLGIRALRGLSVLGRFQFRVNEQPVTGGGIMNNLSTFWQAFEISLKHKWLFAAKYGVEVGAGWTREQYRFNGTPTDKQLVPDAQYESIRVGGRFSILLDAGPVTIEPALDLETRLVRSGGPLQERFGDATSINGLRAAGGFVVRKGGVHFRAEAALLRYAWDFDGTSDTGGMADAGVDQITLIGVYAGYAY